MRRILLLVAFTAAGISALVWLAGGLAGPGARQADPEVQVRATEVGEESRFLSTSDGAIQLDAWEGFSGHAKPEPVRVTDPKTGESVLVPAFVRWFLVLNRGKAAPPSRPGAQRARAEGVELVTYREPRTLSEARALARGAADARDRLVKWHVTAAWGEAGFLKSNLGRSSSEDRASDPDTRIVLGGGVRIRDIEEQMEIESETLEIQPYRDRASGEGYVVVRQPGLVLRGDGIEVHRQPHGTHLTIERETRADLHGDVIGPDGKPLFDLGQHEVRPGHVRAEGGAVLDHAHPLDAAREKLTIEMNDHVHVEQTGGRSLDSERLRLRASRLRPSTAGSGPSDPWHLERLQADGRVLVEYPSENRRGQHFFVSARGDRLVHEAGLGEVAETQLVGSPAVVTLRGDLPFEGPGNLRALGQLHATAAEEIWVRPVTALEVPPGADPLCYRRVDMKGRAFLEHLGGGVNPTRDTLEGDSMTLLLKEVERDEDEEERPLPGEDASSGRRIVAVSFAVRGDVQLGGTRMNGMTEHLVGRDLDTDEPVLTARGPETSFAFHDLGREERLLGGQEPGSPASAGPPRATESSAPPFPDDQDPASPEAGGARTKEKWVVHRLLARHDVVVRTQVGGPAIGLPARIEGEELTYDRTPDLARVRGARGDLARLAVGIDEGHRQKIAARTLTMDRRRGVVEADGAVRAVVFLSESSDPDAQQGLFAVPEAQPGEAATLGLATNGFIEVRTRVDRSDWSLRPGIEQVIHVEGDLVAELTSQGLVVDTLRSRWLEVGLVRTVAAEAPSRAAAPTMRAALPPGPATAPSAGAAQGVAPAAAPPAPTRWDIETTHLAARLGADGLDALRARGGVTFSSPEATISGTSFLYDAARRQMHVHRGPRAPARAVFGKEGERNEVRAQELVLTMGEDGPEQVVARGPASVVLLRQDPDAGPTVERFRVAFSHDAVITPSQLVTNRRFHVRRDRRSTPGGAWESAADLWAERLVAYGQNLLSQGGDSDVRRIVALGPPAVLRTGEGEKETKIWGSRFDLDVATSTATLSGDARQDLLVRRGPDGAPELESEQSQLSIDIDTGEFRDAKHVRFIVRGGGR